MEKKEINSLNIISTQSVGEFSPLVELQLPKNLSPYRGKGKVLGVKTGYNPNSSSLGSVIFSVPALLIVMPVLLSMIASFVATKGINKEEKTEEDK